MSEFDTSLNQLSQDGQFNGDKQDGLPTAGVLLRSARESAGLHIAALAVALKVPVKKLEALEADRYDLLPDAVFARALASSVCRTLKIDVAPVLERLPQKNGSQLRYAGGGINTPFRATNDGLRPSALAQGSRAAMLSGIALLLGALILIFLPQLKAGIEVVRISFTEIAATETPNSAPTLVKNIGSAAAQMEVSGESAALLMSTTTVASPATPVSASATGAAVGVTTVNVPGTSVLEPTSGIVAFTAKSTSWVEVNDAGQRVILQRTLNAGESVSVTGMLPLSVIVGRADATDVRVRGKSFDLSSFSKNNVARFEVK